jgi:hypothetical protein
MHHGLPSDADDSCEPASCPFRGCPLEDMNHACSHCLLLCREHLIDVGDDCTILVGMAASPLQNLLTVADSMEARLSCTHCFKALPSPSITVLFILYSTSWIFVCNVEVLEIRFARYQLPKNRAPGNFKQHVNYNNSKNVSGHAVASDRNAPRSSGSRHVMYDESQITRCLHPRGLELSIMLMRM